MDGFATAVGCLIQLLQRRLLELLWNRRACTVPQHVELAERTDCLVDRTLDSLGINGVGLDRDRVAAWNDQLLSNTSASVCARPHKGIKGERVVNSVNSEIVRPAAVAAKVRAESGSAQRESTNSGAAPDLRRMLADVLATYIVGPNSKAANELALALVVASW